jgi:hypothetical protein
MASTGSPPQAKSRVVKSTPAEAYEISADKPFNGRRLVIVRDGEKVLGGIDPVKLVQRVQELFSWTDWAAPEEFRREYAGLLIGFPETRTLYPGREFDIQARIEALKFVAKLSRFNFSLEYFGQRGTDLPQGFLQNISGRIYRADIVQNSTGSSVSDFDASLSNVTDLLYGLKFQSSLGAPIQPEHSLLAGNVIRTPNDLEDPITEVLTLTKYSDRDDLFPMLYRLSR